MTLDLPICAALPAALLLIDGGLLTLIGALGLLRLRALYSRHAAARGRLARATAPPGHN